MSTQHLLAFHFLMEIIWGTVQWNDNVALKCIWMGVILQRQAETDITNNLGVLKMVLFLS